VKLVRSINELQLALGRTPRVFVPTMGALHTGHGELLRVGKTIAGPTGELVLSIFVNPLQFGASEDFGKYPRTESQDIELAESKKVDFIWLPLADELLSSAMEKLSAPEFGNTLEGKLRPGHFDGVLTIVNRLFELVQPTHAVFGVKDLQQLILVRELAEKRFPTMKIVAVETVRNESGLALSSRNKYLTKSDIQIAAQINKALNIAALSSNPAESFKSNLQRVGIEPSAVDYAEIVEMPANCLDLGEQRLVVAVRIGSTRLLDNIALN
jgi:pantoate--beta-alanine ligase